MRAALFIPPLALLLSTSSEAADVRSIQLDHTAPVPAQAALTAALQPFLGTADRADAEDQISEMVLHHYQAHDFPVVLVSIPATPGPDGVLHVVVTEGRVGTVSQPGLRLQPGDLLTSTRLQQTLDDLQRNPFHHVTVAATLGVTPELANLQFDFAKASPILAWASFSNDGVKPLGEARWLAGATLGDLGCGDQTLTVQGQMAEDYATYHAVLGEWKARLPWHHEISLTGAIVETEAPALEDISVQGAAWFAGAKYLVPWRSSLSCAGETWLGMDVKHLSTDVLFGGDAGLVQPLDIATFTLGEKMTFTTAHDAMEVNVEAIYSPGGLWGHSDDADYAAASTETSAQFFYARGLATWTHTFVNQASLLTSIGGQWADGPLLASEAYYLTGANAVRGYRERSVLGSKGLRGSVEARSAWRKLAPARVQGVAFVDAGHTLDSTPISLGTGLRAQLGQWGQLRCEAAWPLTEGLPPRLHLSISIFF